MFGINVLSFFYQKYKIACGKHDKTNADRYRTRVSQIDMVQNQTRYQTASAPIVATSTHNIKIFLFTLTSRFVVCVQTLRNKHILLCIYNCVNLVRFNELMISRQIDDQKSYITFVYSLLCPKAPTYPHNDPLILSNNHFLIALTDILLAKSVFL